MLNIIYSAKSNGGVFSSLIKNVEHFVIMVKNFCNYGKKKSIKLIN